MANYDNLARAIIGVESGGDPYARNPRSSAGGAAQFTDATWLDTIRRHRPDLAQGKTDAQLLQLKFDPNLSRELTGAYASDNASFLQSKGIEPTDGALRLSHFAGPSGAAAIYADPGASVTATLGEKAAAANPFLRGKTNADMIAWADRQVDGKPGEAGQSRLAAALGQGYGGGQPGSENAPLAAPMAAEGGADTIEGNSGLDRLKSALGMDTAPKDYDADRASRAQSLLDTADKTNNGSALGAFGSAIMKGVGSYMQGEEQTAKKTADASMIEELSAGIAVPPVVAALLKSSDPNYRQLGLNELIKMQGPKGSPAITMIKGRDPVTGREVEQQVIPDGRGGYKPFSVGGSPAAPTQPPVAAIPQALVPAQPMPPQAPLSASPAAVSPAAPPPLPAQPTPLPQQAVSAPPLPAQPASVAPSPPAEPLPADVFEGPAADKSLLGEGTVQQFRNGRGLYRRLPNGGSEPMVESKAQSDARAKGTEAANIKRSEARVDSEREIAGIRNLVNTARTTLPKMAGLNNALGLTRAETGAQILGQSVDPATIGYTLARTRDPSNPTWAAYDALQQLKGELQLKIARPLMKGQGQVSNQERDLVKAAIGNVDKASDPVDLQFRLNAIDRMISDMNSPEKTVQKEDSYRPTRNDLRSVYDLSISDEQRDAIVSKLAEKYGVTAPEMKQYAISQWQYMAGAKQKEKKPSPLPPAAPAGIGFDNDFTHLYDNSMGVR